MVRPMRYILFFVFSMVAFSATVKHLHILVATDKLTHRLHNLQIILTTHFHTLFDALKLRLPL